MTLLSTDMALLLSGIAMVLVLAETMLGVTGTTLFVRDEANRRH
ncbi:hypothetical protein [Phreatobacter sp.]|nr:hypothetical protein [Phreatobacter sp.]MCZ8313558.1 hypothetical protein [Phreatobacter sp.]